MLQVRYAIRPWRRMAAALATSVHAIHRRPLIMTNMSHLRRAQCRLGIYDRQELSELAKVNIEAMKEVGYFTYPVLGGQEVKLKPAQDYCSSTSMACCRLTSPCNWLNRSLRKWSVRFCV